MTRAELLAQHPAPMTHTVAEVAAADLDVAVVHVEYGMVAHRTVDRRTAACGAEVGWCIGAYRLLALGGRLCRLPACWGSRSS